MKLFTFRLLTTLFVSIFILTAGNSNAQSGVFNPNDPIINYNPANPPTQPISGPGKWVRTSRMTWNTTSWKCYIYKGIPFRLKYPKTYIPGDGKKYPLFLFLHGIGEDGDIYDNEYQLYLGGKKHNDSANGNGFDGYLLYPQISHQIFSSTDLQYIQELITQYLIPEVQVDPFRILVNGLSGGGGATWNSFFMNPKLFAAVLPISNASSSFSTQIDANKFTRIWLFQGALDKSPSPVHGRSLKTSSTASGANFRYTEYPTRGHECWNQAWAEPDYFQFLSASHKANPWSVGGRTEFCQQEVISHVIGVAAGFVSYQWRKNGVLIAGATSNTITATSLGVYDCRIIRAVGDTSVWSPIPVELKLRTSFVSPTPEMVDFASNVLPSPDGKTTVQLKVPEGAISYSWTKVGTGQVGTSNIYTAGPGTYQVVVTENDACPSTPSLPFTVINANGPNKPPAVRSLIASKISKTSLKLNWIIDPGAGNPATNFEIYQATQSGGPYEFVGITDASVLTFTKVDLTPGVKYYYVVRAVNSTAASNLSSEVNQTTDIDVTAPTAPVDLRVTGTTRTSIAIEWNDATDDAGIGAYDIYVNGAKMYTTFSTNHIVTNLDYNILYRITVKARDVTGNESPFSNQVTARTVSKGLTYKYFTGGWANLPDFDNTQVRGTGFVPNVDLTKRSQETQFGFLWEGYITIPVAGNYTFRTVSADGSKLYFNSKYGHATTATVDNNGVHGSTTKTSVVLSLSPGVYPIAITYFQSTNTPVMDVYWRTPQTSGNFVKIPDVAFIESSPAPTGLPNAPGSLTATPDSYKKISLSWADNSNNESAFELMRSTDPDAEFAVIAALPANTTSFQDSNVVAATKYYYRIRAINQNGESGFDKFGRGVDYFYYNTSAGLTSIPNFNNLSLVKSGRIPNFSLGMQTQNDNFAVRYKSYIKITSAGTYRFFTSSDDGSRLYINGSPVVNNDGAHGVREDSGTVNLGIGLHEIEVRYFESGGSETLTVSYAKRSSGNPIISKQIIPITVLGEEYTSATTAAAPPAPSVPFDLHSTSVTKTVARFTWSNNDPSVIKYEIHRSFENNQDYVLYTTVTNNFYTDTVLFPNSNVYYKIKSLSATGKSDFSEELHILTPGETPVLDPIEMQYMRFGTQLSVYVNATIATSETISLSVAGLPSFGSFTSTGNGKGTIVFNNPLQSQQGTYSNIVVTATSPQGNAVSKNFSLIVNSNNLPLVTGQASIAVGEGQTGQAIFTASDADAADNISWSYQGLPSFVTVTNNAVNRTSTLSLAPLIGSAGTYNVIAKADDGKNGKDTMAFIINVTQAKEILIHFAPSTATVAASPWNSIGKLLAANETYPAIANPGFKDSKGAFTNVRIRPDKATTPNFNYGFTGASNAGVYPDKVIATGYTVHYNTLTNFTVTGLDKTKKYTFTFFGNISTASTANFTGKYTINTEVVQLDPKNNTQNVAKMYNVAPNDTGAVIFNVNRGTGNVSVYSYINSVVITESTTDAQSIPSKVTNFQIKFEDNAAKLTWTNTASNATGYEVYRSNSIMGPYALLNPGANNGSAQSYIDNTVQGNKTYYYIVRAVNSTGGSNSANQKIIIPNRAPVLTTVEAFCKTEQTATINVTATDDVGETITLVATQLPSFVTFTDNGNGTGVLNASPAIGNKGVYNITITATDNNGASGSGKIKLYVTDKNTSSIFVNFNSTVPVSGIWNSFNKPPTAAAGIFNLKNDLGTATTVDVALVESWTSAAATGVSTGDNSGAVRDEVLQTFYTFNNTTPRNIKISGLSTDASTRYNLIFVSSVTAYDNRTTVYTAGGKTDSVNAANNSKNVVQINGLTANSSGEITYTVTKPGSSAGAYINALIIQSYTTSETLLAPDNFRALAVAKDSIKLVWNNRSDGSSIEVYRSTSANGTYNLITTVSGNTYTDFGLLKNTEYFYKLKAVNVPNTSPFSNIISASTYSYSVYINYNIEFPAALPWNNTNQNPTSGVVYDYLNNDEYVFSGISMLVGDGFSGSNPFGETTGTNSSVAPVNVWRSSWWADVSQAAELRFRGLSQNKIYRFTFISSRSGVSPLRVSTYTIGDKTVKVRSSANKSETVSIDNVYPDENGEVVISIQGEGSSAYINGLIISAANIPSNPIDGLPGEAYRKQNNNVNTTGHQGSITSAEQISSAGVKIYPNPFSSDLKLMLSLSSEIKKLNIKITDPTGRTVLLREMKDVKRGTTVQALELGKLKLPSGIYIINVYNDDGFIISPVKVLKK